MNSLFVESHQISAGFVPIDLQAGSNDGDWFNMAGFDSVVCIFFKAAGTAGDDPTVTMSQATSNAGGGATGLSFTRVDVKQGTLTSVAQFTTVTQSAASTYTDATSAEIQAIWVVEVSAEDLADGYKFVRMRVSDVGSNAQLGACLYIGRGARRQGATLPSSL